MTNGRVIRGNLNYLPWDAFAYPASALDAAIRRHVAALPLSSSSRVVDYGCGDQRYRRLFADKCEYIPADIDGDGDTVLTINASGELPLHEQSCDVILSTQVLEHVTEPLKYLQECRRVLKPGGKLLLSTHGLMFKHPHPLDLWRWTDDGLIHLVENAGFKVVNIQGLMGLFPTGLWLVMVAIQHKLPWGLRQGAVVICNGLIWLSDKMITDVSRLSDANIYLLYAEGI